MNTFYKIFCRVYQFAFHAALPVLPYREPKRLSSVLKIREELLEINVNSVLLVTDGFLRKSGITSELEQSLSAAGITCAVYDKVSPNPTVKNVEEAKELYLRENCAALIGFGGGSSIDCAKAVGACIAYPKRKLDGLRGNLRILRKTPPMFAVPTTAGTGSEVTVTAVITDSEKKYKYTMNSFPLIPNYAVLDPKVTVTLPQSLTATTGMDALTHAVEAYIGRSTSKATREMSLTATRLIFENIETAYSDGGNLSARANMLKAAYLAGNAFSQSYVGYVHAVAHSLGGQYNIPHGLANSVILPNVLEAYGAVIHKQLFELGRAAGVVSQEDSLAVGAEKFIAAVREKNARLGIPTTLQGIRREEIPIMARHAAKEANPLYPVPVLMDAVALEKFYRQVAEE